MRKYVAVVVLSLLSQVIIAQDILPNKDLSNQLWYLWLDENAQWENDELYLPPVDIKTLPQNEPTCGWEELEQGKGKVVTIPATIEQYFWGNKGSDYGISGNYVGVSWFTTQVFIPADWEGKRVYMDFESVRLRAEVYLNRTLVGYDMINGTPFKVDISKSVVYGKENFVAVRITDPNGNFAWRDWETYKWGKYNILPSHGFGGITGKVSLSVKDNSYIDDVFVKNTSDIDAVDVEIYLKAKANLFVGKVRLLVNERGNKKYVWKKDIDVRAEGNSCVLKETIAVDNAQRWSVDSPNLYTMHVMWESEDGSKDDYNQDFGFRWFEVREVDGDKQFYLNDKRIVLRTAISWGHWPVNGIFPSDELAKKQIQTAKDLGLNMLNFHRGIGQNNVFKYADELGLLYYEEPGGYRPGEGDDFAMAFKREKLLRMVKRDRNHPSLVIYSMINESNRDPQINEVKDIQDAHKIDESRIITFTSTNFGKNLHGGKAPLDEAKVKMHMLPYSKEVKYFGWYDEHHAGGPGSYNDEFYNGPEDFLRYVNHPNEIIFWGEEGAIGTPPRLELVQQSFAEAGQDGWDGDGYRKMYGAYDRFITENGFREAFPTMESFTKSMGEVSHYYQGRIIENIRIGNLTDGYAVNGWEDTKVENHSGIVDVYRNPKADPSIMAYYNQPLYVAVKARKKVVELGETVLTDLYIVNERDVTGDHLLKLRVEDSKGLALEKSVNVKVSGGSVYGELLQEAFSYKLRSEGYTYINASLEKNGQVVASGSEAIYSVGLQTLESTKKIAVLDSSGVMQQVLNKAGVKNYTTIHSARNTNYDVMLVGANLQPGLVLGQFRMNDPLMDWVAKGKTLLIIAEPENWGEYLSHKEILDYRGFQKIGRNWFGGNFFVRDNPYFDGLPVNTSFNWEYQCLSGYNMHRVGLRLGSGICYVGVNADHKHELYSALSVIPYGSGKIVVSSLDLSKAILSESSSNVVAKKIVYNMLSE